MDKHVSKFELMSHALWNILKKGSLCFVLLGKALKARVFTAKCSYFSKVHQKYLENQNYQLSWATFVVLILWLCLFFQLCVIEIMIE